jgi:hypothetical protein
VADGIPFIEVDFQFPWSPPPRIILQLVSLIDEYNTDFTNGPYVFTIIANVTTTGFTVLFTNTDQFIGYLLSTFGEVSPGVVANSDQVTMVVTYQADPTSYDPPTYLSVLQDQVSNLTQFVYSRP